MWLNVTTRDVSKISNFQSRESWWKNFKSNERNFQFSFTKILIFLLKIYLKRYLIKNSNKNKSIQKRSESSSGESSSTCHKIFMNFNSTKKEKYFRLFFLISSEFNKQISLFFFRVGYSTNEAVVIIQYCVPLLSCWLRSIVCFFYYSSSMSYKLKKRWIN